jgi:hypothetical protein
LFFRAQHGQILNLSLKNELPLDIPATEFDHAFPPCPARPVAGRVHAARPHGEFDPICADGASVGWNYISGPVAGKTMRYRWWLDQEFGHDLLPRPPVRQLPAEARPVRRAHRRARRRPLPPQHGESSAIVSGAQARIDRVPGPTPKSFREFCMGLQDFIPMWNRDGEALKPAGGAGRSRRPGDHGDQLSQRPDP